MKRRHTDDEVEDSIAELARALVGLRSVEDMQAFLVDLCTPAELEALTDRWRVVPLVAEGVPYREIHERTLVSVTTIGRVARTFERGTGGYAAALARTPQAGSRETTA